MKKILIIICFCHSFFWLKAQEKVIQNLINQTPSKSFISYSMFTPTSNSADVNLHLERYVRSFNLLNADESKLIELANSTNQAIEIQIPIDGKLETLQLIDNNSVNENTVFSSQSGKLKTSQYYKLGRYYSGVIKNNPNSVVAISFFEHDIIGMISTPKGNYVLGKSNLRDFLGNEYIIYNDKDLLIEQHTACGTTEAMKAPFASVPPVVETVTANCVKVYIECDYQFYLDHGSNVTTSTNFATGLFNLVSTLYLNDSISIGLSQIVVWTSMDPYYVSGYTTYDMLLAFSNAMSPGFNGDIAHLLSDQGAGGGIAWLDVLCDINYNKCAVSASLGTSLTPLPSYSWNTMVVTHEMGHNMGSPHTHACAWNGNSTRIDNCAGNYSSTYQEGTCNSFPPDPVGGGTIMSYCHLSSVGINLTLGFGPQPGTLIRSRVNTATCLTPCIVCQSDITITNNYSTALTESSTWIQTSGQTTILNTAAVKLDANPSNGYVLIQPSSTADYFESSPTSAGYFVAQAFDGCGGGAPAKAIHPQFGTQDEKSLFTLFPNPAFETISIQNSSIQNERIQLEVYGIDGKKVQSSSNILFTEVYTLNIKLLPRGLYIIKLYARGNTEVMKFQKE